MDHLQLVDSEYGSARRIIQCCVKICLITEGSDQKTTAMSYTHECYCSASQDNSFGVINIADFADTPGITGQMPGT